LCPLSEGDSLTNFVTFLEKRLTETRELAHPSLRAKRRILSPFARVGADCALPYDLTTVPAPRSRSDRDSTPAE